MRVHEVMTRNAVTIGADETLVAAARKMKELGVGALPVLEDGTLTGIVTNRDSPSGRPRRAPTPCARGSARR